MPRTAVPGASTLGVTSKDVEAARKHRDSVIARHDEETEKAQTRLAEIKQAHEGVIPADKPELREEVKELFAEADKLGLEVDAARDHLADVQAQAFGRDPADRMDAETAAQRGHAVGGIQAAGLVAVSLVKRMVESEAYQAAKADGVTGLEAWKRATSVGTGLKIASVAETQQLLSLAAATLEPLVGDDQRRLFPPSPFPMEAPRVLDLISITSTDKDAVDYAVTTDEDGNVTGQPYGTAGQSATLTTAAFVEEVKRRLTLLDVPEGVLDDESRLLSWLRQRFQRWLRLDTESQVLHGNGTGQNFTGIFNWAGVNGRQRALGQVVADAILDAITDVRLAYHEEPNGVALRPDTWAALLGERSPGDGHYVNSAGPFGPLPNSMWGKTVAATTLLRDGTGNAGADPQDCLVGFFPEAELVVREGYEVRDFEQNKDNVEKGMVTIRGQYRAAFIVNEPVAFTALDLTEAAA